MLFSVDGKEILLQGRRAMLQPGKARLARPAACAARRPEYRGFCAAAV